MMNITRYDAGATAKQPGNAAVLTMQQTSMQNGAAGGGFGHRLLSLACALGGTVRNTVYVTLDALRGRYGQ